jgi:hypothetical protein
MKILLSFIFATLSTLAFSQSQYSVTTNRVVLTGVINQDTFLLESINNTVQINGQISLLEIIYHNAKSRNVSKVVTDFTEERGDFDIMFHNEYLWLDEMLKSDQAVNTGSDQMLITFEGNELSVPVKFTISRLRGIGPGFKTRIEIFGQFDPEEIGMEFDGYDFKEDVYFNVQLTVLVENN